ncbi:hypothetical protein BDV96DRAFT_491151 [Lophiotrema nucula]|uniref:Cell death in tomato 1 n=1 Tax=Lophiotrema nucula TaxID=690887 RepID=A0A6A5ZCI5_9PLEO|nr:hypothetical protein BDV96DRAFT_491151 [Lophiotrema nucula]
MLTKTAIFSVLAAASIASGAPAKRQDTLQPWQVTSFGVHTPSGRPGSYPWSTITANITDPNALTLGTTPEGDAVTVPAGNTAVNCVAKWFSTSATDLHNHLWPCDPTEDGYWYFEVLEGDSWDVQFTRVADVLYQGSDYKKTYTATGTFRVGDNLSGTCGGSGVCNWGLKSESIPVLVTPTEVTA